MPIVALTAAALEQDIQESMSAGCTAHLGKPVKKMLLPKTIKDMTHTESGNPVMSCTRETDRRRQMRPPERCGDRSMLHFVQTFPGTFKLSLTPHGNGGLSVS